MTGATQKTKEIYQFRFRVIQVSPIIWRRIHVASESSISDAPRHHTNRYDVFQLGHVIAELFTGKNPDKRAEHDDFLSKVDLDPVAFIPGSSGKMIEGLIPDMVEFDPEKRPQAGEMLELWRCLFFNVTSQQSAIEGRVL